MQFILEEKEIYCNVSYTKASKISMEISPEGLVDLRVPKKTLEEEIQKYLYSNRKQILRVYKRLENQVEISHKKEYVEDEHYLYLGKAYTMAQLLNEMNKKEESDSEKGKDMDDASHSEKGKGKDDASHSEKGKVKDDASHSEKRTDKDDASHSKKGKDKNDASHSENGKYKDDASHSADVRKKNDSRDSKSAVEQQETSCTDKFDSISKEQIQLLLKRFYTKETKRIIKERVSYYERIMNVHSKSITIVDSPKTWGTCNNRRELTFNYRLSMAPIPVIDSVVIHELCHIFHLNHDRSFWRKVGSYDENYQAHEDYLNRLGFFMTI